MFPIHFPNTTLEQTRLMQHQKGVTGSEKSDNSRKHGHVYRRLIFMSLLRLLLIKSYSHYCKTEFANKTWLILFS